MSDISKMEEHMMRKSLSYISRFKYNGGLSRLPYLKRNYSLNQFVENDYPTLSTMAEEKDDFYFDIVMNIDHNMIMNYKVNFNSTRLSNRALYQTNYGMFDNHKDSDETPLYKWLYCIKDDVRRSMLDLCISESDYWEYKNEW